MVVIERHTLLEMLDGSMYQLECDELEAALLESGDDRTNEATLDTVGLCDRVIRRVSDRVEEKMLTLIMM